MATKSSKRTTSKKAAKKSPRKAATRRSAAAGKMPPNEAIAQLTNVTATNTVAGGFLTTYAAGSVVGPASSVNWSGPDQHRAALTGGGLGAGAIGLFASSPTDVVVDLAGWFT